MYMTKKIILILLLALCGIVAADAQRHEGRNHDKMMKELQEFKLKFLAQEMDLQDDQKEKFVELYNEMSEKRIACMKEAWKLRRQVKHDKDATEADYEAAAEAMKKAKAEDSEIEKSYDDKFAQFLTSKQMFKMKAAEEEFRKKMEEMRSKRGRR